MLECSFWIVRRFMISSQLTITLRLKQYIFNSYWRRRLKSDLSIILTISRFPDDDDQIKGFSSFWLRYVHGFSPHFHCQQSLLGENDPRFTNHMTIGAKFELEEPLKYRHIYLCGVTSKQFPGLHFALLPKEGASAVAKTYNGLVITAVGAKRLEIPELPDGFAGMDRIYTTCCNWKFGVEYYGISNMRRELIKDK